MTRDRAWVMLPSRRRLDLLAPVPDAWTDVDLATGLSRTYRWGGHSRWPGPLSVAQHSLTVLAFRQAAFGAALSRSAARRELLHDAVEGLIGWDAIAPLKPHLGRGFARLVARLQAAVDTRYALPAWTAAEYASHKQADRLAAASEAYHVAGWSRAAIRHDLGITLAPATDDPVPAPPGMDPCEPWPAELAAGAFLDALQALSAPAQAGRQAA